MKTSINLKNMRVLLSMLFVFLSVNAVAQNITGTVKDSQGEPIIGASVVEKGTSNGVVTNLDGQFTLKPREALASQCSKRFSLSGLSPVSHIPYRILQ